MKIRTVVGWFAVAAVAAVAQGTELEPLAMSPLPLGSVMPEGWLKVQLDQMTEGLCGRLYEHSRFLSPSNGWLVASGEGWEEQPYWFRGFVKTAVLTGNERMLAMSRDWVDKILSTQDADGWYGPADLKAHRCANGHVISDIWGHMVMNEALLSWYEYSGDARIPDALMKFYRYLAAKDDSCLIPNRADSKEAGWQWSIQKSRAGDAMPAIFACYERTQEPWLLDLAFRIWRRRDAPGLFLSNHNVNFAQLFGYGTVLSRMTRRPADRASAGYWYDLQMGAWGSTPRCGFAADEMVRLGCTDPRYATETCTWAEFVRSFGLVGSVTGETVWGDRTEDVVFNWYPISYTPGWKELHYLTAGNQVNLDAHTDHNYNNKPPQVAYSGRIYRCCRHNAHFGIPLFCESLVMRDRSGALDFWMYAPHRGNAGDVAWKLETEYPFRETAKLTFDGKVPALRFRVPGWCRRFEVRDGATTLAATEKAGGWLDVKGVRDGATLDIAMKAECTWRDYPRHGGISLERGPLTYSLAIRPVTARVPFPKFGWDGDKMYPEPAAESNVPENERMVTMVPEEGTRWNFALDRSVAPTYRELPFDADCFRFAAAPAEITVKGHALPEWTLQDNQPAALQNSPAYTTAPAEDLRFIPMCCARLHVTVFPEATDNAVRGYRWNRTPPTTERKKRPQFWATH